MGLSGYYHSKISELEKKREQGRRLPFCFICNTVIRDLFCRVRYLENESHELFKIFFHYFPPCFDFDSYQGIENTYVITDGYEINTDYLTENLDFGLELVKLDRLNLGIDLDSKHVDVPLLMIRLEKNQGTTLIRDYSVNRKLNEN